MFRKTFAKEGAKFCFEIMGKCKVSCIQAIQSRKGRGGVCTLPHKVFWKCAIFFEELFKYAFLEVFNLK